MADEFDRLAEQGQLGGDDGENSIVRWRVMAPMRTTSPSRSI
jgi:hypothetical protein